MKKNYRWELSLIPDETKNAIMGMMDSYESFDLYCGEAGWEDWMNEFTEAEEGEPIHECEAETIEGIQRVLWEMSKEKSVNYKDLSLEAMWNCIDSYKYDIDPYGDYDDFDADDMDYQIEETLATGLFSIDSDGNWYDEEGNRI